MRIGTICPDGFLPAYSVDTKEEATQLLAMLPLAYDGKVYAQELLDVDGNPRVGADRIDAFVRFGKRLEFIHNTITLRKIEQCLFSEDD